MAEHTAEEISVVGQFDGRVALVTGAGSGIGRASALAFAREGARVMCADINALSAGKVVAEIAAAGGSAESCRCDVAEPSQVDEMIATTLRHFGRLDFAHNNAGVEGVAARAADIPVSDWERVIRINLTGVWLCMRAEIPVMKSGGAIVNTSSASGLIGGYNLAAYTAAKHGVVGLTKAAALDYATSGIRINAVCPGAIATPFILNLPREIQEMILRTEPIGRFGLPEEVADAVIWLCSERASFAIGLCMPIDGGVTVNPSQQP
jgi:NAD(P)-dependent dehydrogenase (short-subunit alcohol dehydrogenase family)